MDGVTIVNTVHGIIGYTHGVNLEVIIIFFVACIVTFTFILSMISLIKDQNCTIGVCLILLLLSAIGWYGVYHEYTNKPIWGELSVVIVSDDVYFNEFMDKYEIVRQ